MGKKKRTDPAPSPAGRDAPFHSPFAALGGLRASLPEGEPPREAAPGAVAPPPTDDDAWLRHKLVVRHERKGHGGKTVTRLEGVEGEQARQALARRLARVLGCGSRVEGEAVVLAGDLRPRLVAWLTAQGARRIVAG